MKANKRPPSGRRTGHENAPQHIGPHTCIRVQTQANQTQRNFCSDAQLFTGKQILQLKFFFLFPLSQFKSLSCFLTVIQLVLTTGAKCIHTAIWTDCLTVCVCVCVDWFHLYEFDVYWNAVALQELGQGKKKHTHTQKERTQTNNTHAAPPKLSLALRTKDTHAHTNRTRFCQRRQRVCFS